MFGGFRWAAALLRLRCGRGCLRIGRACLRLDRFEPRDHRRQLEGSPSPTLTIACHAHGRTTSTRTHHQSCGARWMQVRERTTRCHGSERERARAEGPDGRQRRRGRVLVSKDFLEFREFRCGKGEVPTQRDRPTPKVVSMRHDSVSLRRINRLSEAGKSDSLHWKTATELIESNERVQGPWQAGPQGVSQKSDSLRRKSDSLRQKVGSVSQKSVSVRRALSRISGSVSRISVSVRHETRLTAPYSFQ